MPLARRILAAGQAMSPLRAAKERRDLEAGRKCTEQMNEWRPQVERLRDAPRTEPGTDDWRAQSNFMLLFDCVSCWKGADDACAKAAATLQ